MHSLRMNRFWLCGVAAAVLSACSPAPEGKPPAGAGGPPPAEVVVTTVRFEAADITQDLPGRLQAVRTAQVRARVEGVVEKRLFNEGTEVQAGTPLFQVDARSYRAAAEAARADALAARLTVERYKPLLEARAVSQQDHDTAVARLKLAEATLAKAELDLENALVLAPISGRVGRALVTEGALVGRGESTPLTTIEQIDPIYVNFTQNENTLFQWRQALQRGSARPVASTQVRLVLPDGSLYRHAGKLTFSDMAVDPNTGAVLLRAEFPNPQRELLPGSFVRVRFPQVRLDKALRVPQRAVQMNASGPYVLRVGEDNKVTAQPVVTGAMSGDQWVVDKGLEEGMRVIVDGLQKAKPGATVKPVDPSAPSAAPAPSKGN